MYMIFDCVIGNPPYEGRSYLYLKILHSTWLNANDVAWLCPTTFVDDVYKRNETFNTVLGTFGNYLKSFEDVDPSGFDMQVAQDSLGIFNFNKNCKSPENIYELAWRKFENPVEFKDICKKIIEYCKNNSLRKNRLQLKKVVGTKAEPNNELKINPSKWYVGSSWVRGSIGDWTWVTLLGLKDNPIKGGLKESWFHGWEFNTEDEANQFCKYLNNSNILKFSIAIEKKNQTNNPGDFNFFPISELPWDEKTLGKKIGLSEKNIETINNFIKKYNKN